MVNIDLIIGIIIFIVVIILFIRQYITKESFYSYYLPYPYSTYSRRYPYYGIWWQPTRSTRGMSYDLRGDVPIPSTYIGPWNISSYAPIRNKPLALVS
jgi:hypothetical protein